VTILVLVISIFSSCLL